MLLVEAGAAPVTLWAMLKSPRLQCTTHDNVLLTENQQVSHRPKRQYNKKGTQWQHLTLRVVSDETTASCCAVILISLCWQLSSRNQSQLPCKPKQAKKNPNQVSASRATTWPALQCQPHVLNAGQRDCMRSHAQIPAALPTSAAIAQLQVSPLQCVSFCMTHSRPS